MNKRRVISLFLVLALALGALLTGCGKDKDITENNETQDQQNDMKNEEVEQILNVALDSEPDTLDPSKASDINSGYVIDQVTETLTRLEVDEDGKNVIKPAAAETWEQSEDGLEWTFHLRDAKWSDGKDLVAEDFVYGIQRTLDPKTASPIAMLLKHIKNAQAIIDGKMDVSEAGAEAIDEKTLKITLEYPVPYFLNLTSAREMHPQRKDIHEQYGSSYGTEGDKLIFCGPFVIDEWVHNNQIVLSKNDTYWDKDSVKLDKLVIKIITEETAIMGELENGTIDIAEVSSPEWIERLDKEDKFDKLTTPLPRTEYMFFNQEVKPFSNPKVRKAFSIAVDREEIQKSIYQGLNEAAYGWIAPPINVNGKNFRKEAGDPVQELIKENPDPKALLIEGLKELGMDEDPSKVTVTIMLPGTSEEKEFGEYLQQTFNEKLGVNIELDPTEWPVFQERNRQLDYEIGYKSWGVSHDDPSAFLDLWLTGTKIVPIAWSNPEYDTLVKEASLSLDEKERLEKFKRAEEILVKDDCAIIPYSYLTKNTYKHKYVKGVMEPDFGYRVVKYAYIEK
ncbi:peptide ABC transporter substrate-binding protein [Anaerosalibacter sp. Marseille-P3206]|uniref:peptide ABC transporter substrate-binding protein n=1 Tax=Anaerosalibacter sp. Marseille-P3206 TaxID=1871005 RepID=UPI0009861D68|nr:peptide ABC transporter substrate-binding protein [Anaerosalibacter sp. Marseille-P3206]